MICLHIIHKPILTPHAQADIFKFNTKCVGLSKLHHKYMLFYNQFKEQQGVFKKKLFKTVQKMVVLLKYKNANVIKQEINIILGTYYSHYLTDINSHALLYCGEYRFRLRE